MRASKSARGPSRRKQVLDRQWVLRAKESAAQLTEHLRGFVNAGDGITVVEVGEERASRRALADLRGL
jgi:hypothetical protein